jgi:hypothetical protein
MDVDHSRDRDRDKDREDGAPLSTAPPTSRRAWWQGPSPAWQEIPADGIDEGNRVGACDAK